MKLFDEHSWDEALQQLPGLSMAGQRLSTIQQSVSNKQIQITGIVMGSTINMD